MAKRIAMCIVGLVAILALVLPGCGGPADTYALTIQVDPPGAGTATFTGTSPFAAGVKVPVQATANEGYQFSGWSATAGYFDEPLETSTDFNMPAAAATITAEFGTAVFPTGAMVGELVFSEEKSPTATVAKIAAGSVHAYLQPGIVSADVFEAIVDAGLPYDMSYGSYRDIRYNPVGPIFDGTGDLNPFNVIEIREAMMWLIDRSYVVGEILGGLGGEIYGLAAGQFPESQERYPDIVQAVADYYAPKTPAEVWDIIEPYMLALNCTWNAGEELWYWNAAPVELQMLIRSDLRPFPEAGDYVANLLEDIGFETVRQYKTSAEASPIWLLGDPNDGLWHVYTGGWGIPTIPRDQASTPAGMQTASWYPVALYEAYEDQIFLWDDGWTGGDYDYAGGYYDLIMDLFNRNFSSLEQREDMFEQMMWGWCKFSAANLLVDLAGASPHAFNVDLLVNLSFGPGAGWVQALHFTGAEGPVWRDQMQLEMESVLVNPWNPVDGSNWTYDLVIVRDAMREQGLLQDPTSGLFHPWRLESAEVTIADNLPVAFSEGVVQPWLSLTVLGEGEFIPVPDDAWSEWDATTGDWISCATRFPDPGDRFAARKSVVVYPSDIFDLPYHDGSPLSLADFLMEMILPLDIAQADSPIYESARVSAYNAFMTTFKGYRITDVDPLTIEVYDDSWFLDPCWNVAPEFPTWKQGGSNPWHMIAIGWLTSRDNLAKFGTKAATALSVPWLDYTKGDAMDELEDALTDVQTPAHADEDFVPYGTAIQAAYTAFGLGSVATEAAARYANLQAWYDDLGHFWVDAGLYYLDSVYPVEKNVVLKRFEDHPDPYDRWLWLLD